MSQEHRGAAGGTQISQSEAGRRYPEIPARSDQFGNWKETWGRSAQELVYQPHHWLQTRGVVPRSPPLRQCAWMKVTVKMHAGTLGWCGILPQRLVVAPSQCFNFGFDLFSEMLLLISRRRRHRVWPRRVSRFRPEWDCALPHRVYGAQHRHLSFRIFISIYFFYSKTASGQLRLCWGWGHKKKNVLGRDFRNALAFARIRTVRRLPLLCIAIWERGRTVRGV